MRVQLVAGVCIHWPTACCAPCSSRRAPLAAAASFHYRAAGSGAAERPSDGGGCAAGAAEKSGGGVVPIVESGGGSSPGVGAGAGRGDGRAVGTYLPLTPARRSVPQAGNDTVAARPAVCRCYAFQNHRLRGRARAAVATDTALPSGAAEALVPSRQPAAGQGRTVPPQDLLDDWRHAATLDFHPCNTRQARPSTRADGTFHSLTSRCLHARPRSDSFAYFETPHLHGLSTGATIP